MHNPDGSRKPTDMNRFWFAIQGLLGAVGNISKILWPSAKQSEERGIRLRVLVSLDDSSCLAPRTFRNHLEHFDERLETWFEDVGYQGFADSCIGPTNEFGGLSSARYLRNYATDTETLWFRGDSYALAPIMQEAQLLLDRVSKKLPFG